MEYEKEPEVIINRNIDNNLDEKMLDVLLNVSQKDYEMNNAIMQRVVEDVWNKVPFFSKKLIQVKLDPLEESFRGYLKNGFLYLSGAFLLLVDLVSLKLLSVHLEESANVSSHFWLGFCGFNLLVLLFVFINWIFARKDTSVKHFNVSFDDFSESSNAKILYLFSILLNNQNMKSYLKNENETQDNKSILLNILGLIKSKETSKLKKSFKELLAKNLAGFMILKDSKGEDNLRNFDTFLNSLSSKEIFEKKKDILYAAIVGSDVNLTFPSEKNVSEDFNRERFLFEVEVEDKKVLGNILDDIDFNAREELYDNKVIPLNRIKCLNGLKYSVWTFQTFISLFAVFMFAAGLYEENIARWGFWGFGGVMSSILLFLTSGILNKIKKANFNFFQKVGNINKEGKNTLENKLKNLMIVSLVLQLPSFASVSKEEKLAIFKKSKLDLVVKEYSLEDVLFNLEEKLRSKRIYKVENSETFKINLNKENLESLKKEFLFK